MNTKEIEKLIVKFYEGETSLDEEKALRAFFAGGEVPEHLQEHRGMFGFFEKERSAEIMNETFDDALFARLEHSEGRVVGMSGGRTRNIYIASVAAAAVLLIAVALTFVFRTERTASYSKSDEMAYANAREALMIVSSNLNRGVSKAMYLKQFDKGMQQMQMLSKFYQYQTIITNPDEAHTKSTTHK